METLEQKVVKTRKEHHCFGCARKFPKGSKMLSITSVDGGRISTEYWCETCQEYWERYMEYDDSIGFGELKSEDGEVWEEVREDVEGVTAFDERV